jgi:hypothetical protein
MGRAKEVTPEGPASSVVLFQDREWFGDPRPGAFSVSIAGNRVGKLPVRDALTVPVSPGRHVVGIRQWWYRSPPLTVDVEQGGTVRLRGDVSRSRFLAGMAQFLFTPSSALVLTRTED